MNTYPEFDNILYDESPYEEDPSNLTFVSRREPFLAGSPQFTPWETNEEHLVEHQGNVWVPMRVRDSYIPTRPSRHRTVFFLQPTGDTGDWGDWWAAAFIQGKDIRPNHRDLTVGMFTLEDQRRNIAVPPTESFGDYVGEADGVSPYGLD